MYIAYPDVASALSRPRLGKYSILTEPYQLRVIAWKMEVFWEKYTGFNPHSAPWTVTLRIFGVWLNWIGDRKSNFPLVCIKNDQLSSQNSAKTDCGSGGCGKWDQECWGSKFLLFANGLVGAECDGILCCLWVWVLSYARKYWKLLKLLSRSCFSRLC